MIYLAAIYVLICGLQLAFTIWRDTKESSRRISMQKLSQVYADKSASSEERVAIALEYFKNELNNLSSNRK